MIQFKPGDLVRWSYCSASRSHLRTRKGNLSILPTPQRVKSSEDFSSGLILQILDTKQTKYFISPKDQLFLWFSLKEGKSFKVFQNELSLVEKS